MSFTFDQAVAFLRSRLEANWTATALRYQNEPEDPPKDPDTGKALPFVYMEVLGGQDEQASWGAPGANLFRRTAVLALHAFVPIGEGDPLALQYVSQLGAIFRGQDLGSVVCREASIGGGGAGDDDGNYWRRSVTVDFWTDEAT